MQVESFSRPLVLHDAFLFPGGGERVALELAELLNADLATGAMRAEAFPPGFIQQPVENLGKNAWPMTLHGLQTLRLARRFTTVPLQERPCTVFSGPLALLGAHRLRGPKVHYCHTPPRLLYDLAEHYLSEVNGCKKQLLSGFMRVYRRYTEQAVRQMDLVIANSHEVRRRIAKYWGLENVPVVHPPCGNGFTWLEQGDYYLSTARLDPLKRVDHIIRAFLPMPDKRLVIASDGPEAARLRQLAGNAPHIIFTGLLDDDRLRSLVGRCLATVYVPMQEDFGISPVESMAAGKAVIGVDEGGLRETVLHERTGWLLPPATLEDALRERVRTLTAERLVSMREACEQQAAQFAPCCFQARIRAIIQSLCPVLSFKD